MIGWEFFHYYFAGSTRIALKDGNGQVYYYHSDHLGNSTVVTYGSGPVTDLAGPPDAGDVYQQLAYYPYGGTRLNSLAPASGVKHKYTGQELDDSTGLYYYGARYYDPVIGRFISADPIVPNAANPQAFNRYSYVYNNPLKYTDPSGYCGISSWGDFGDCFSQAGSAIANFGSSIWNGISSGASAVWNWLTGDDGFSGRGDSFGTESANNSGVGIVDSTPTNNTSWWDRFNAFFSDNGTVDNCRGGGCYDESENVVSGDLYRPTLVGMDPYSGMRNYDDLLFLGGRGSGGSRSRGQSNVGAGAAPRLIYEPSPKHGETARGQISAGPQNGQAALDTSIQVKPTSPRRIGIEYDSGQFVVFDRTVPGKFHGHVRPWDQLTTDMQRALINSGMTDRRGRILE